MLSEDAMGLRPATLHENGLRAVSAVFSAGASPIFTAAKHLLFFVESKGQIPRFTAPYGAGFAGDDMVGDFTAAR